MQKNLCRAVFFGKGKEKELKEASAESFNIADLFQER
jgi:hypothetical protein